MSSPTRPEATSTNAVPENTGWPLRQPYGLGHLAAALALFVILAWTFKTNELDRAASMTCGALASGLGLQDESPTATAAGNFFSAAWPFAMAEARPVARVEGFDPERLPWFAYLEMRTIKEYDALTNTTRETEVEFLVEPFGYLTYALWLMLHTATMGLWGTVLALLLAAPLGFLAARNYAPHASVAWLARGVLSLLRAVPELISAAFFLMLFGPGPAAGILALGFHNAGLLGKLCADDIENADQGTQQALASTGAAPLKVFRFAVFPQLLPQFVSYTNYILERSVRYATVLGIVGAGGIGVEFKGRWEHAEFAHVSTLLLVIFLAVFGLEQFTQYLRRRLTE
jgi:phosphonate transport system permease protein